MHIYAALHVGDFIDGESQKVMLIQSEGVAGAVSTLSDRLDAESVITVIGNLEELLEGIRSGKDTFKYDWVLFLVNFKAGSVMIDWR